MAAGPADKVRVVILGAGFAGLFTARGLRRAAVEITVVDQHNYHLFQPLLYQVATAGLAPSDIAWPIRGILSRQKNATVLLDRVTDVDLDAREVVATRQRIPFDYLVVATGARHAYFGHDDWSEFAPGLKSINDATFMRRRVLLAFERAEMADTDEERARLMRFVIVGGGPTGVELAGAIAELARRTLAADFRHIDSRGASVILLEAGSRVLSGFPETLSSYAENALRRLGVNVQTGATVTHCGEEGVVVDGKTIASATVLWAAGVAASPAGRWLQAETDKAGRVRVEPDLSLGGHDNIFVIGDTAAVQDANGKPVPGIAPAAKQQGKFVADVIDLRVAGKAAPKVFRYRHQGNLATIGRKSAVIEWPSLNLRGMLAWWVWGIAHIYFLIGVRSPVSVAINWFWQYVTYGRGARLITGSGEDEERV